MLMSVVAIHLILNWYLIPIF